MSGRLVRFLASAYDKDNGQTGIVACPTYFSVSTSALTAGRAYAVRFRPSRTMTIALVAFNVSVAAGADDACDVGIYDAAFNRLVSSGATTGKLNATTGVKTIALAATTLSAGVTYYAAFSVLTPFGGTAASLVMTSQAAANLGDLFGTGNGVREQTFMAAHPLPNPFVPAGQINNCPLIALRES